jgi:hypothetical protein
MYGVTDTPPSDFAEFVLEEGLHMDGGHFYKCRWCGGNLVRGDKEGANRHLLLCHLPDWHRELEKQGLSELEAHQKVNALVEFLRAPLREIQRRG